MAKIGLSFIPMGGDGRRSHPGRGCPAAWTRLGEADPSACVGMNGMRRWGGIVIGVCGLAAVVLAESTGATGPRVADLAFLTGTWRGEASTGLAAEELISAPRGGVMLAAAREFRDGRCVFYDLVVFAEREGWVELRPYPMGRPSPHVFPLVALDAGQRRVEFHNPANDFPQTFIYVVGDEGVLEVILRGGEREERYRLRRIAE